MPELPEVETIARELREKIIGESFSGLKKNWPGAFINSSGLSINKRTIRDITRKGKYMIFDLDSGYLIIHLRMTGQVIVQDSRPIDKKHLRLTFSFSSGKHLLFYDLRKFGRIYLTENPEQVLKNTGIDAFDPKLNAAYFFKLISNRTAKIKSFLLNQKNIAGLGNIYIDESLYRAGIHPESQTTELSRDKSDNLFQSINDILTMAIDRMGTTISNYKTSGGGFGENQNFLRVYGRQGEACFECSTPIIKIKHSGRGTHFCPKCQPLNKAKRN